MDDVGGDFLGPPHGTTPAAVTANKSSGHINEIEDGPYQIPAILKPRTKYVYTCIMFLYQKGRKDVHVYRQNHWFSPENKVMHFIQLAICLSFFPFGNM